MAFALAEHRGRVPGVMEGIRSEYNRHKLCNGEFREVIIIIHHEHLSVLRVFQRAAVPLEETFYTRGNAATQLVEGTSLVHSYERYFLKTYQSHGGETISISMQKDLLNELCWKLGELHTRRMYF